MSGENYDSEIEKNAATYGYKTANLMYLLDAVREFEASDAATKLHELYGDIEADVPGFQGIDAKIIEQHLDQHASHWRNLFENFQNHFNKQTDKNVLSEPAKESLKKLQELIIECFDKHQISEELFNEFLSKNNLSPNDLVMVRSTGVNEDKADMANPGGNESLPSKANIAEISRALGVVAESYIGEKSLSQRLGAGDNTIVVFPVMPGLVQRLIGEGVNSKGVFSGVLYSNNGSTRMQAAPGHCEYVVNSKGPVDNYYVSPEQIVYSEIKPKDFRLKPNIDPISNKVNLEKIDNPFEKKYEQSLSEPVVLYMKNSAASDRVSKQVKLLCFFFNFIHCVYLISYIFTNYLIINVTYSFYKKTLRPKFTTPKIFTLYFWIKLEKISCRYAFYYLHNIRRRNFWLRFYYHMNMISRYL